MHAIPTRKTLTTFEYKTKQGRNKRIWKENETNRRKSKHKTWQKFQVSLLPRPDATFPKRLNFPDCCYHYHSYRYVITALHWCHWCRTRSSRCLTSNPRGEDGIFEFAVLLTPRPLERPQGVVAGSVAYAPWKISQCLLETVSFPHSNPSSMTFPIQEGMCVICGRFDRNLRFAWGILATGGRDGWTAGWSNRWILYVFVGVVEKKHKTHTFHPMPAVGYLSIANDGKTNIRTERTLWEEVQVVHLVFDLSSPFGCPFLQTFY